MTVLFPGGGGFPCAGGCSSARFSSVIVSRIAFVRSSISAVMLRKLRGRSARPPGSRASACRARIRAFRTSSITSSSVRPADVPAEPVPAARPRTAWDQPECTRCASPWRRWCVEIPYFSAMSVVESCRSPLPASSKHREEAKEGSLVQLQSISRSSSMYRPERSPWLRKERQRHLVVPVHHRPHRRDTGPFHASADLVETSASAIPPAHLRGDGPARSTSRTGRTETPRRALPRR